MFHFMNKNLQKQQPLDDLISVRPQVFSFELGANHQKILHAEKYSKIRYKDKDGPPLSLKVPVPKEDFVWRPKIPCKKIYEQPKFLLSLERKKIRVINGLRGGDLESNEVHRSQLKNFKRKHKKQVLLDHRPKIISHPQKMSQNYTHTSLNLQSCQTHRISKTPYLNFNLHHLIKERRNQASATTQHNYHNQNQQQHHTEYPPQRFGKKGSNLPYHAILKSQRFQKSQRSSFQEPVEILFDNIGIRGQVRTAKTSERRRNVQNKSMANNRRNLEEYQLDLQPKI